ncbi:MAG: hypothetical protein IKV59_03065 [Lachnospiraceae bacterium]|nr:hypothetical protein [Lachnospiraceae bacterium]
MSINTGEHIRNFILIFITTIIFVIGYYMIPTGIYGGEYTNLIIWIGPVSAHANTGLIVLGALAGVFIGVLERYIYDLQILKWVKLFYPGWLWLVGTVVTVIAGIFVFCYAIGYHYMPENLQIGDWWRWIVLKTTDLFQTNTQFELLCVVILSLLAAELFVWIVTCIMSYTEFRKNSKRDKFSQTENRPYFYGTFSWMVMSICWFPVFYGNIFGKYSYLLAGFFGFLGVVFGLLWSLETFTEVIDEQIKWKKIVLYVPFWSIPSFVVLFIWNAVVGKQNSPGRIAAGLKKLFVLREIDSGLELSFFVAGMGVVSMIIAVLILLGSYYCDSFSESVGRIVNKIGESHKKQNEIEELTKKNTSLESEISRLKKELDQHGDIQKYENNLADKDKQIVQLTTDLNAAEKRILELQSTKNQEKKVTSVQDNHSEQTSNVSLLFDVILSIPGMDAEETVEEFWSHMEMDGKNKAVTQLHLDTLLSDVGIETGMILKGMEPVKTALGLKKAACISGKNIVAVKKQGDVVWMESDGSSNWILTKGIYDILVKVDHQMEIMCILELA